MSIGRQTLHGVSWQLLARGIDRGLRFASSLVLTRMLAPEAFGQIAATMIVIGFIESFSFVGIEQALIQSKRGDEPRFLGSTFKITAGRGAVIAMVVFLVAPIVAWYFEDPALSNMVRIVSIASLVRGFENPWIASARRALRFKAGAVTIMVGAAAQVSCAIAGAWFGLGATALALAFVASAAATSLAGWILIAQRLDFTRDEPAMAELRGFAAKAAGVPFLITLCGQVPALVLGRISGLGVLGVYGLANQLSSMPNEIALPVLGTVLTPAYAQIREDVPRLRAAWLRSLGGVAALIMPITAAVIVLDDALPTMLYGPRYAGAPGLMSLLALTAAISSITACCGAIFWAIGRPHIDRVSLLWRLGIMVTLGTLGAQMGGVIWFAAAVALAMLSSLIYCLPHARVATESSWREIARALLPAAIIGSASLVIASLVQWSMRHYYPERSTTSLTIEVLLMMLLALVAMSIIGLRLVRKKRG